MPDTNDIDSELDDLDQDALEHDDDREIYGSGLDPGPRDGCVLGEACIAAAPFHSSDECWTAEMAEAYERELGGEG